MEMKKSYRPEEIAGMQSTHKMIKDILGELQFQFEEAKTIWGNNGKGEEFERMLGLTIRNRLYGTEAKLRQAYEEEIPENMRKEFPLNFFQV